MRDTPAVVIGVSYRGFATSIVKTAASRKLIAREPQLRYAYLMVFTKRLREPIMRGEITCSVRIWRSPHVKLGGHYRLGAGFIEVTSVRRITLEQITPGLAQRSGFAGVVDLLKVAKHGPGENVYLIEFEYHADTIAR